MSLVEYEKKIEKLEREIKIKDNYLDLIWMIGCDYDGYNTVKSLQELIDELVDMSKKARVSDDKSIMYTGVENKKFNILHEEIK